MSGSTLRNLCISGLFLFGLLFLLGLFTFARQPDRLIQDGTDLLTGARGPSGGRLAARRFKIRAANDTEAVSGFDRFTAVRTTHDLHPVSPYKLTADTCRNHTISISQTPEKVNSLG